MQRLKALIMVTFGFSRSESRAFIILLPTIFLIVFIEPVYQAWFVSGKPDHFADAKKLDSLVATWKLSTTPDSSNTRQAHSLFAFNPNTVSMKEMDSLGISPKVSQRIEKYRAKGGKFRVKSDLGKIYGLDQQLFASLEPYIDLPKLPPVKKTPERTVGKPPIAAKMVAKFDLNSADTVMLCAVNGIGPTLARRIINYRNRLGGFVHHDQLYEVWGLDSMVVERTIAITEIPPTFVPKTINLNTITETELAGHPYMKGKSARLIVTYRFQHGNFTSIADLEKINLIDSKTFNRIRPYLTLE